MLRWRRPDVFVHEGRPLGGDVDWAALPWPPAPEGCDRKRILSALRAIMAPRRRDWSDGPSLIRYAVGNGHSGTIYPAAVPMTSLLLTIAENYPGAPRAAALNVLETWWGGFMAEPGWESYVDQTGTRVEVIPRIATLIEDAVPLLRRIADDPSDPVSAESAAELLEAIPHGW